jgi:hypothetical protein
MGLSGNQKALMYALGAVARGGATRGGYHSMLAFVSIGGVVGAGRVLVADLTISDVLDETANTCQLTVMGTNPSPGADIVITLGSINSGTRLFAGKVISEEQGYFVQNPANVYHRLNGIDYTWLLSEHLVIRQYANQTVAAIATDLIASFAEGMTANHIAADAGAIPIDAISFTNVALADALTQLCSRAGAYWYLDYFRDLHLFETESTTVYPDPTPLTPTHPTLQQLTINEDLSQIATRVLVEGGGGTVIVDLAPGETIIPVDTVGWYQAAGGQIAAGAQRIRYSGIAAADGIGSLVGPGVTPTTPVSVTPASGAGVTIGVHDYAVSYVTAAGESLVGPRATVNVTGLMAPPVAAPTPTQQSGGNGPDAGAHYYATTFVTATGETAPAPSQWYMQNSIAAGTVPITIADANDGSGYTDPHLKVGDSIFLLYTYTADATDRVAPFPAAGETPPGPASATYVVKQQPGRTGFMNFQSSVPHSKDPNVKFIHIWMCVNGAPWFYAAVPVSGKANIPNQPAGTFYNFLYWQTTFYTSQLIGSQFNPILGSVLVSGIATGPAGVTARKVYRSTANTVTPLLLLATLADNTTTTYVDTKTDASLGAVAPTTGTAAAAQVAVSSIPIGPATVTGRRLYRTAAGGAPLKLVATLGDNATTTYVDAIADASLGANAPASDTSGIPQAAGTVFAGSPTMILAGIPAAFSPTGGWAIVGNGQVIIRYSGISGNNLTGIPPSGVGSITTSISYGSLCTASPALTGVPTSGAGAIIYGLKSGDGLQLLVTVDDVAAQTALAGMIGGSGIKEAYIQDRRIGYAEAVARGQAMIDERADLLIEVHYVCRDPLTKSGRTIHAAMPAPTNLSGDYKIQQVTISAFSAVPGQPPTYTVQASSQRYSLDDLLRIARGTIGA